MILANFTNLIVVINLQVSFTEQFYFIYVYYVELHNCTSIEFLVYHNIAKRYVYDSRVLKQKSNSTPSTSSSSPTTELAEMGHVISQFTWHFHIMIIGKNKTLCIFIQSLPPCC